MRSFTRTLCVLALLACAYAPLGFGTSTDVAGTPPVQHGAATDDAYVEHDSVSGVEAAQTPAPPVADQTREGVSSTTGAPSASSPTRDDKQSAFVPSILLFDRPGYEYYANKSFVAKRPSWCGSPFIQNVTISLQRLHDIRLGVCGLDLQARIAASGCADKSIFGPEGALCRMAGHPRDQYDWDFYLKYQHAVCNMPSATRYHKCEYACVGFDAAECDVKSNSLVSLVYNGLRQLYYEDKVVDKDELALSSAFLARSVSGALQRHLVNILAQVFGIMVFVKPLHNLFKWLFIFASALLYAMEGGWVQVICTASVSVAFGLGATINNNNIYFAVGSIVLSVVVVTVDAVNDIYFSFAVTAMLALMCLALLAALVSKRLTVDVGSIIHFIAGLVNLTSRYRAIIDARRTDPAIAFIIFTADGALPWGSLFVPFFKVRYVDARVLALHIIKVLEIPNEYLLLIWLLVFVHAFVSFFILRAIIGYQITRRIRGANAGEGVWLGFLLVWANVTSPLDVIGHLIAGRGPKYFSFDACCAVLKVLEIMYAPDLALASVVVALIMYTFDFQVTKVAHTLSAGSFGNMFSVDLSAFPSRGSLPSWSADDVMKLRKAVVRLTVKAGDVTRSGVGFVVKRGAELCVYTVAHVLLDARSFVVGDKVNVDERQFTKDYVGTSSDTVVCAKITSNSGMLSMLEADGVVPVDDMSLISPTDSGRSRSLLFLSPDGCANLLGPSLWKMRDDSVDVSLDLKHGDSGSPIFAVLDNGAIRYLGAVSRGRGNGEMNVASTVLEVPRSYSPGTGSDPDNTATVGATSVSNFSFITSLCKVIEDGSAELSANPDYTKSKVKRVKKTMRGALTSLQKGHALSEALYERLANMIDDGVAVRFNFDRAFPAFVGAGMIQDRNVIEG